MRIESLPNFLPGLAHWLIVALVLGAAASWLLLALAVTLGGAGTAPPADSQLVGPFRWQLNAVAAG
jgi:hypothetical protein